MPEPTSNQAIYIPVYDVGGTAYMQTYVVSTIFNTDEQIQQVKNNMNSTDNKESLEDLVEVMKITYESGLFQTERLNAKLFQ